MKVGRTYQARTRLFGKPFAVLKVLDVAYGSLCAVTDDDARAEGYRDRESFLEAFCRINGLKYPDLVDLMVWTVYFTVQCSTEGKEVK